MVNAFKELAFFGKITAGITHEMNNVLAIIKESAGLMEDIISLSPEGSIPHEEKIQKSLARIKDQIRRGVGLTERLNRFAHCTDESPAKVDLIEMVERLIALSERFVRQKNVVLKMPPRERSDLQMNVVTHPVLLQMALFECIQCCLDEMPSGGEITIEFQKNGEKTTIKILRESHVADSIASSGRWPALQEIAGEIKAIAEPDESGRGIRLTLPEKIQ